MQGLGKCFSAQEGRFSGCNKWGPPASNRRRRGSAGRHPAVPGPSAHRKADAIPSWVISCREVLRELSNYIESDLDAGLRSQIDTHLSQCAHCTAIYEGTNNLLRLVAGGKVFELPEGFSQRLRAVVKAKGGAKINGDPNG